MRAALVAIFVFAALLASGHYVGAPFFCRGGIVIPTLDARELCGADLHLNRAGSVLLYFSAVAIAVLAGVVAALFGGRSPKPVKQPEAKHAETFEEILAKQEKEAATAKPAASTDATSTNAASTNAAVKVDASAPAAETAAATTAAPAPVAAKTSDIDAAIAAALFPAEEKKPEPKPEAAKDGPAPETPVVSGEVAKPATPEAEKKTEPTETRSAAEAITVGLAVSKNTSRGSFDGTNEELLERFRELKKQEGVNSIAQAQRLLDESTLSALAKGIDPKQHLSQVAHLVLAEDPDLKSGVVRGVVVHIAARLKELGVAKQNIPGAAKGAA